MRVLAQKIYLTRPLLIDHALFRVHVCIAHPKELILSLNDELSHREGGGPTALYIAEKFRKLAFSVLAIVRTASM